MLVLSHRKCEKIFVPSLGISVEVLYVTGNKVRLEIEAPRQFPVYCDEVAVRLESALDRSIAYWPGQPAPLLKVRRASQNSARISFWLSHQRAT